MHRITVISKEGCHLCERAIAVLQSLKTSYAFDLEVLNIEHDESLHNLYFLKIPVIRLDGMDRLEAEDIALPADCKERLEMLVREIS